MLLPQFWTGGNDCKSNSEYFSDHTKIKVIFFWRQILKKRLFMIYKSKYLTIVR